MSKMAIGTTILTIVIVAGALGLVLWTLPMRNELKDESVRVHFALGNRLDIDMTGVVISPVPKEATEHLIRTNGTSLGKKNSGHFKNTKTSDKFLFYITGNGQKMYFEKDSLKYVIDLSEDDIEKLLKKHSRPLCGGYTEEREPSEEEYQLFRTVTDSMEGMSFTPLTVQTQVVAGINYRFYCRFSDGSEEYSPGHCWLTIYKPLPGQDEPKVTSLEKVK